MAITKVKNLKGRITGYRARRGQLVGEGELPKIAQSHLEQEIDAAIDRLTIGTHIYLWHGHTMVVCPDAYGWGYWIDTCSSNMYRCSGYKNMEEARIRAFMHLAQNLWTLEVTDDGKFVEDIPTNDREKKDLLSWCRWQRSYAALRAQGLSENDAHRMATAA